MIGDIYARAHKVNVWLNRSTEAMRAVFEYVRLSNSPKLSLIIYLIVCSFNFKSCLDWEPQLTVLYLEEFPASKKPRVGLRLTAAIHKGTSYFFNTVSKLVSV